MSIGAVTAIAASLLVAGPAAAATQPQAQELPHLTTNPADGGQVRAVNDAGEAGGTARTADAAVHAVRWDANGRITDLGAV